MDMNRKDSILTYALVGLAVGTVAWLLLGTKEGRKQMDRAGGSIRDFGKSIRESAGEGIRKASEMAGRASEEISDISSKVAEKGQAAAKNVNRMAKSGINKVSSAAKAATRKAGEEI